MQILRAYAGPAGILLLGAGLVNFLLAPTFRQIAYILVAAGFALLGASVFLNLEDFKSILSGRAVKHGANAAVYTLIVLLIVATLNFLASRHSKRFDLTEEGLNTLSDQSVRILEGLQSEVEVIGFFSDGNPEKRRFEDIAASYRYHSDYLKVRIVDPYRSPGEARRLDIKKDGTIVIQAQNGESRMSTISEEQFSNAILKATRTEKKSICFTTGHGESATTDPQASGYARAAESLRQETYAPRDLLLLQTREVPEDCTVVVVAGPQSTLMATEVAMLEVFLAGGGRLLVLKRDPRTEPGLGKLLARYGLKVNSDVIVDKLSRAFGGDEFVPVVTQFEPHAATKIMTEKRMASFFPVASTVETVDPELEGAVSQVVARTTGNAWGETGEIAEFDESEDRAGPVGVMGVSTLRLTPPVDDAGDDADSQVREAPGTEKESRIVLFGDSDFASNAYLHLSGNSDLFLNSIAWLADESDLISIRSKRKLPQPVTLTASRQNLLSLMTFATPLAAVIAGVMVWARRRRL